MFVRAKSLILSFDLVIYLNFVLLFLILIILETSSLILFLLNIKPNLPFSITSTQPSASLVMIGKLQAIASIKTIPKVSKLDGKTKASDALKCNNSSLLGNLKFLSKYGISSLRIK